MNAATKVQLDSLIAMNAETKGEFDSLVAKGFDPSWLTQILTQYGPDILKLIADALAQGLSVPVITEAVMLGGKILLAIITGHLQAIHAAKGG